MNFLAPYMLYIKLALAAAALGGVAYFTWNVRGGMAEGEKAAAVADAVKSIQAELDTERRLRTEYRESVDKKVDELLTSIGTLRKDFSTSRKTLAQDIKSNPDPYAVPVPLKGYEAWMHARQLARSSAQQ